MLSSPNLCYNFLISSLSNKKPTYVILILDLEDISVSFLHVRIVPSSAAVPTALLS
jgi:hypothetical protein